MSQLAALQGNQDPRIASLRLPTQSYHDADAVEDYEAQALAVDPIAFTASKSDPDMLNFNDVTSTLLPGST
jgi:hypothetical protein